jgi:hypothetical protein
MRLLTKVHGWKASEVDSFCAEVRDELKTKKQKMQYLVLLTIPISLSLLLSIVLGF